MDNRSYEDRNQAGREPSGSSATAPTPRGSLPNSLGNNRSQKDSAVLSLARRTLDQGLCFDRLAHITRATDEELIRFAESLRDEWRPFVELLHAVAYPRRGTNEEVWDIQSVADRAQAMFEAAGMREFRS